MIRNALSLLTFSPGVSRVSGLLVLWTVCGVSGGCGGSSAPRPAAPATGTTAAPTAPASAETSAESGSAEPATPATTAKSDNRKWVGDIPYDVFYDDPLAVASNTTPVGGGSAGAATGSSMASGGTSSPPPATTAAAPPAASSGGADWKSLITAEQISDETKRIRNHLTASLQSQGTYNGNMKDLQVDGAVIAALSLIIAEHAEDVSWKPNARYLREFGYQLNQSAVALGRESFSASQSASENIQAVLNGNLPADAGDPPAKVPYSERASRSGVMKRIEKASEWMRANINSESVFDKELDQIRQEAALLAALAKLIADHSYESADEDDYENYAKNLMDGAVEAGAGAAEKSYPKFQSGMNKVQKACAECHANYAT